MYRAGSHCRCWYPRVATLLRRGRLARAPVGRVLHEMKRVSVISVVLFAARMIAACGEDSPGISGSVTPEADGGAGAGSSSGGAAPTPDLVVPTQEPTATPRPTFTPIPR